MGVRTTEAELNAQFIKASGHAAMPDDWTPIAGWIRVSGDKQDERIQVDEVIKYCIQHKYWIVRWFIVHAKSASKGKQQKDLDDALEGMRNEQYHVLVIPDSSRLERREGKIGTELLNTLAEFVDAGGRVESCAPSEANLGQMDLGSRVMTYITGVMNTEKSKTISREVRRAHNTIRRNKAVINRVPGVWYTIKGDEYYKHAKPTHWALDYWPEVIKRCIAGESTAKIAAWLDSEGVPTEKGGKWNQGTVLHLIHNPIFCGRRFGWGPDAPLLKKEQVISVDLWTQAQEAIANRPKRGPIAKTNKPMLSKLKCPRCGAPMYRKMIGGRLSRRYVYRCEGQGPQRKGCGNLVPYERLEFKVACHMLTRFNNQYQIREWAGGTNWDAEIADTVQSLQALPQGLSRKELTIAEYNRRHAELMTLLADYQRKNEEEATSGGWEYIDVLNNNGTVMTEGQHFFSLDRDGRREYLKAHDIRAERSGDDIRLIFDGEEVTHNPYETLLVNIAGPEIIGVMLDAQIPNADVEMQALLTGEKIPGAEEFVYSYLMHRVESKGNETKS